MTRMHVRERLKGVLMSSHEATPTPTSPPHEEFDRATFAVAAFLQHMAIIEAIYTVGDRVWRHGWDERLAYIRGWVTSQGEELMEFGSAWDDINTSS